MVEGMAIEQTRQRVGAGGSFQSRADFIQLCDLL